MSTDSPVNWPEPEEAIQARFRRVFNRDMTSEEKRMLLMRYPSTLPASNGVPDHEVAMMEYDHDPRLVSRAASSESPAPTGGPTVVGTRSLIKGALRVAERILTRVDGMKD